jgi:flagellar hook assembly protein FlgD
MTVYDVRGREVTRLLDRSLAAGDHEIEWTGRDASGVLAPSGVYFVVLKNGNERVTRRVVLLR